MCNCGTSSNRTRKNSGYGYSRCLDTRSLIGWYGKHTKKNQTMHYMHGSYAGRTSQSEVYRFN